MTHFMAWGKMSISSDGNISGVFYFVDFFAVKLLHRLYLCREQFRAFINNWHSNSLMNIDVDL